VSTTERRGCVQLVGAGPGDPKLLTVRATECLRDADVVAYDELVSPEILALAPPAAERLAVGRRHGTGKTSYRLHPDVLARARDGKRVVRLKAGDPLIFGRGGEEAEELVEAGIPFEIVPGVSSALGAAAYAGIPLTHRDHASHVTFATGHDVDGSHGSVGAMPATTTGTLVLFMASRKLAANLARLIEAGRDPATPAAYIASATTDAQIVVVGTIADLPEKVRDLSPTLPAIVIVGDVVSVRARIRPSTESTS
jgi:uroporphyrinogen III methyltransferase/synthase